jgi:CheY-like chemotaxis protein
MVDGRVPGRKQAAPDFGWRFWVAPTGQGAPKVIVIDDDEECLGLMCRILRDGGYKTVPLTGGAKVVDAVEKHDPALVLTDLLMPGVTGGMVYDMIRAKVGPYLPVVVCSGTRLKFRERDPLRGYIRKPVDCETMLKTVGDMIGLAEEMQREEEAEAARHSHSKKPPPPAASDEDDLD